MPNVRNELIEAKLVSSDAAQGLREAEKDAIEKGDYERYRRLSAAYDIAKAADDAATLRLLKNLIELPTRSANKLATAVVEMKRQLQAMERGRGNFSDFISVLTSLLAGINLISTV